MNVGSRWLRLWNNVLFVSSAGFRLIYPFK